MSTIYSFHASALGFFHSESGALCEDASASYSSEDSKFHIAIIADGHGSGECFRSSYGAKVAVEVTMECLCKFAEANVGLEEAEEQFYYDMFSNSRYQRATIRRLSDTIIAEWTDRVLDDYNSNPPSIEEMGEVSESYDYKNNPLHIYGTTLIAALWMPKCVILLHQGDGRCDVFYSDGSVNQPVPWDDECVGNITTSLSNEDAAERIRSLVIDLTKNPVIACYLGCDGVEDAYRDSTQDADDPFFMMGVHTFYKDIVCQIVEKGPLEFESKLETMLSEFSAKGKFSVTGSGDDVSVAGIVDLDEIEKFANRFESEVNQYAREKPLEEELIRINDDIRSKTRGYKILQKRLEEAQAEFEEAQDELQKSKDATCLLNEQKEEDEDEAKQMMEELEGTRRESEEISEIGLAGWSFIRDDVRGFLDNVSQSYSKKERLYKKMVKRLEDDEAQIQQAEDLEREREERLNECERKLEDATGAFESSDKKYQLLLEERDRVMNEIAALHDEE